MFEFLAKYMNGNKNDTKKEVDGSEILASITYLIQRNDENPVIDVALRDYDPESIDALCSILNTLGNDAFYIDTINIIKSSLAKENRHDLAIKIFANIESNIRDKILQSAKDRLQNEPCVKPSEMFR